MLSNKSIKGLFGLNITIIVVILMVVPMMHILLNHYYKPWSEADTKIIMNKSNTDDQEKRKAIYLGLIKIIKSNEEVERNMINTISFFPLAFLVPFLINIYYIRKLKESLKKEQENGKINVTV
jgi:uncharacterized membrane protein YozB (DUF420 family)